MGFEYLKELTSHWLRIGNRHIRSIGTWAGNIMLKYKHNEFSSDLFLTLETVNATITIIGPDEKTPPRQLKPSELLMQPSLNGNILFSVNVNKEPLRNVLIFDLILLKIVYLNNCTMY